MLVYLQCDKFVSHGKPRPAITFEPGLNVVRGSDSGDNSIGKSTFLMIVDFAFGGRDYVDETKVKGLKDEIGEHTVYFAFEFDGKRYHFARNTAIPDVVAYCDEDFEAEEEKQITEFTAFLMEKYRISLEGLSFRNAVSGYLRIYHRDNYSETHPLKAFEADTPTSGIGRLLKLFDLYAPIAELKKASEEADEKKKSYAKSQKYGLFPAKLKKAEISDRQESADRIVAAAKAAKADLQEKEAEQTQQIQASADEKMTALNDYVYGGAKQAPTLEIASPSRYEFYTPMDGGTGAAFRGLILFDISVLSLTDLPVLAHDSLLFKNIEDEALEKIMELYAREVGKQVFIAIDKVTSYTRRTQEIIGQSTWLTLSKGGNELFGKAWNIKEELQDGNE